jgi:hypothetical protein
MQEVQAPSDRDAVEVLYRKTVVQEVLYHQVQLKEVLYPQTECRRCITIKQRSRGAAPPKVLLAPSDKDAPEGAWRAQNLSSSKVTRGSMEQRVTKKMSSILADH